MKKANIYELVCKHKRNFTESTATNDNSPLCPKGDWSSDTDIMSGGMTK